MRRRDFIALLGGAAVAWPGAVIAQAPSRLWKIGVLANEPWPPLEGLRQGLRDLGYVESKTHRFEYRFAQGRAERFPALASELVDLPVDLIVAWAHRPASPRTKPPARYRSSCLPATLSEPVSFPVLRARAGTSPGCRCKWRSKRESGLSCSRSCCRAFRGSRCFRTRATPTAPSPCGRHGLGLRHWACSSTLWRRRISRGLDDVFLVLGRTPPDGVLVVADPFLAGERVRIAEQMIKTRLPSIYSYHEHVVAGGLMTYTTNYYDVFRREAVFIDKISQRRQPRRFAGRAADQIRAGDQPQDRQRARPHDTALAACPCRRGDRMTLAIPFL